MIQIIDIIADNAHVKTQKNKYWKNLCLFLLPKQKIRKTKAE